MWLGLALFTAFSRQHSPEVQSASAPLSKPVSAMMILTEKQEELATVTWRTGVEMHVGDV